MKRGAGVGVAGRWTRRHAAPAVVGRFIFFATWLFWRFGRLVLWASGRRRRRTDETGLTPDPFLRTENRQNFIAIFGDFNKETPEARVWWRRALAEEVGEQRPQACD